VKELQLAMSSQASSDIRHSHKFTLCMWSSVGRWPSLYKRSGNLHFCVSPETPNIILHPAVKESKVPIDAGSDSSLPNTQHIASDGSQGK